MTEHLLSCTITALVASGIALAMRGRHGGWRHALLLSAVLRFAVPTYSLTSAGGAVARCMPEPVRSMQAIDDLRALLHKPDSTSPATHSVRQVASIAGSGAWYDRVPVWRLAWSAGFLICLVAWLRRWRASIPPVRLPNDSELKALARTRNMFRLTTGIELRITAPDTIPGVQGFVRHRIVLPDGLSSQLSEPELDAVISHELAHASRFDNLAAAIIHAIVSVFWFHPLLWWMEKRMFAERETACDEMVVAHGTDPENYITGILKVCRLAVHGSSGYAGVAGPGSQSSLAKRKEHIMSFKKAEPFSRWPRALAGTFFAAAALLPVAAGYLGAQQPLLPAGGTDALFQSCLANFRAQRYQEAEAGFRRIRELDPRDMRGLMGMVEVQTAQNKPDDAIGLLQTEINKDPSRLELHLAMGDTEMRAGRYEAALAEFRTVLTRMDAKAATELHVNDVLGRDYKPAGIEGIYLRIAQAARSKGDLNAAIAATRKVTELDPSGAMFTNLGMLLDQNGQKEAAAAAYRAAIGISPDNGVALNNLSYMIAETGGDLDEALQYARRSQNLLPKVAETTDTVGWIFLRKGMSDAAIGEFSEAFRKDPANTSFRGHLAMALDQKDDRSAASEALRSALRSKPSAENEEEIRELLARIGK